MTYRFALVGFWAVALVGLTACHPLQRLRGSGAACHESKPYMRASSIAPLKIPSGLDTPDTASALHVPPLTAPTPPARKKGDPCLDQPPPFNVPKQAPPQA